MIQQLYDHDLPPEFRAANMQKLGVGSTKFTDQLVKFIAYLSENKIFHYTRPKSLFNRSEAVSLAKKQNCVAVLLENLS